MKRSSASVVVVAGFFLASALNSTGVAGQYYAGNMNCRTETGELPTKLVEDLSRRLGPNWPEQDYSWVCWIEGVRWAIRVHRQGADETEGFEAGSDGETTYTVSRVKPAAPGSNDSLAVVENGVVPYESSLPVHPVWLTFCAPNLLKFFPGRKMPALAAMGAGDSREGRMARYEFRYELEPRTEFFSSFELLNDGYIRERLKNGRFIVSRRDPPHDSGFVMARLNVAGFNLIGGRRTPSEAVYERFRPAVNKDSIVSVVDRWKISVTSSYNTNLEEVFWIPNPTQVTDVQDRRYAYSVPPVFSIGYRLKGRNWLAKEDAFLVEQYESATGLPTGSARSTRGYRRVFVLASIILTTMAFCYLLWCNRRRHVAL